jgi:hypothetical protein
LQNVRGLKVQGQSAGFDREVDKGRTLFGTKTTMHGVSSDIDADVKAQRDNHGGVEQSKHFQERDSGHKREIDK